MPPSLECANSSTRSTASPRFRARYLLRLIEASARRQSSRRRTVLSFRAHGSRAGSSDPFAASPIRIITSPPAVIASTRSRPLKARSCPTARPEENIAAPGCEPEFGSVRFRARRRAPSCHARRRRRRLHVHALAAQDRTLAAGTDALCVRDDLLAPGELARIEDTATVSMTVVLTRSFTSAGISS